LHFSAEDAAGLTALLRWRRDVRHFRTDPLEAATLARLQAAVDLVPSVGNARPWRFLRVRSPALRARVAEIFEHANAEAATGYAADDQAAYLALKLAGLREAPEYLAVFTDTAPAAGRGLGRQTMPETLFYSTVMAVHTLWLAARAENVGLGWVSILDPQAVQALMDVPETWVLTAYLCLGHPAGADDTPLLHRAVWQANTPTAWPEI